jgi:cyclin-C
MAASFWDSTMRRFWILSKEELEQRRQKLRDEDQALVQAYNLPEWRFLSIYFNSRRLPRAVVHSDVG